MSLDVEVCLSLGHDTLKAPFVHKSLGTTKSRNELSWSGFPRRRTTKKPSFASRPSPPRSCLRTSRSSDSTKVRRPPAVGLLYGTQDSSLVERLGASFAEFGGDRSEGIGQTSESVDFHWGRVLLCLQHERLGSRRVPSPFTSDRHREALTSLSHIALSLPTACSSCPRTDVSFPEPPPPGCSVVALVLHPPARPTAGTVRQEDTTPLKQAPLFDEGCAALAFLPSVSPAPFERRFHAHSLIEFFVAWLHEHFNPQCYFFIALTVL
jgi:hypothetical protein